jgi:threo-3-hydroxy-L-aspartate ammonia-lyase
MENQGLTKLSEFADVAAAAGRLEGKALRTPVLTSRTVDARTGARVYFKCENFQRAGAFKFRGAYNMLASLPPAQRESGVVAFSSGNHAQAVALAAKLLGIKAVIVMPADAPQVKLDATRGYGAEVVTHDREREDRAAIARAVATQRGLTLVPPFDHPLIVAGQGTAAMELIEEAGSLDDLLVPCGGGGLISGCAIAANHLSPGVRVTGVEPAAGDDVTRSFHSKALQTVHNPDTIADGARTHSAGAITFPLILQHVHGMVTVTDEELLRSMFFLWERMKIIVEPTGALAAAAVLEGKVAVRGRRVGVVLSGGNIDFKKVASFL